MNRDDNRQIVLDFYNAVVNRRDFAAASAYLGEVYIQHRADSPDGVDGLRRFIERERHNQQVQVDIRRVFADGNYVILHAHVLRSPEDRGSAHVDIFRVDGGKVVEHWDVDEPIPAQVAHNNGVI